MPEPIPAEAEQTVADDLMEAFASVPFRFWTCLNKTHKDVTWNGDVASCDTCGLTSTMKDAWTRLVRTDERRKVADEIRALADPLRVATRAFIDRHPGLHVGVSVSAVLLAVADEIEGEARADV